MSTYPGASKKALKSGKNFNCENSETSVSVGKCGRCCITTTCANFFRGPMWASPSSIKTFHFCTGLHKPTVMKEPYLHQYFCIWHQMFFLQDSGMHHYRTSWSSLVCVFLRLIYECVICQLAGKRLCQNRLHTGAKGLQGAQFCCLHVGSEEREE